MSFKIVIINKKAFKHTQDTIQSEKKLKAKCTFFAFLVAGSREKNMLFNDYLSSYIVCFLCNDTPPQVHKDSVAIFG